MKPVADLRGRTFGRLTPLAYEMVPIGLTGRRMVKWRCLCECGKEHSVLAVHMMRGKTRSCGCMAAENASKRWKRYANKHGWAQWSVKHGLSSSDEYGVWGEMIGRCHRQTSNRYEYYGARGISVFGRWRYGEGSKTGFECFISDMGRRPRRGLSIERLDNDGNYHPSNCCWATQSQQMNNTRRSKRVTNASAPICA